MANTAIIKDCLECKSCSSVCNDCCIVCGFDQKAYDEYRFAHLAALAKRYGSLKFGECAEWVREKFPGTDKNTTLAELWEQIQSK